MLGCFFCSLIHPCSYKAPLTHGWIVSLFCCRLLLWHKLVFVHRPSRKVMQHMGPVEHQKFNAKAEKYVIGGQLVICASTANFTT